MQKPVYAKNIIVGVKYQEVFSWYITTSELWYLDYNQAEYSIEEYPEERQGISVLNEVTVSNFLKKIEKYKSSTESIKLEFFRKLSRDKEDAIYDYSPCLFVNFDKLTFYSNYPESISFEEYIPDNWKGYFQKFFEQIPYDYRYWEEKNINYLIRKD